MYIYNALLVPLEQLDLYVVLHLKQLCVCVVVRSAHFCI